MAQIRGLGQRKLRDALVTRLRGIKPRQVGAPSTWVWRRGPGGPGMEQAIGANVESERCAQFCALL